MQSIALREDGKLSNSKVNTLAAVAFIETLCPAKYAMLIIEQDECALASSDSLLFLPIISEAEGTLLQSMILNTIITSTRHLDKTMLCLGLGTHVKGQNNS